MTLARLRLTLPDGSWGADVSRAYTDATFRILATIAGQDRGADIVSVVADQFESILDDIRNHETTSHVTVLQLSSREATVQFDTDVSIVQEAAIQSGLPIESPIRIRNGVTTVTVIGSRERLSAFGRELEQVDVTYDVEFVGSRRHTDQILTERQTEIIRTAIELGFYDTPRRCTLTELANHFGIAKSTCSETLQRAEGQLIKRFVRELPGGNHLEVLV